MNLTALIAACGNIGYDLHCGACAELFFCGATITNHESDCNTIRQQSEVTLQMEAEAPCASCQPIHENTMKERADRIRELRVERTDCNRKINYLDQEIYYLQLAEDKEHYTCSCVKVNKNIGVFDSVDQVRANRSGLTTGYVSNSLSAKKDCPLCNGFGRAQEKMP